MDADRLEWLKLIHGVVTRLAGESSNVKTWAAALTTGLLVASRLASSPYLILMGAVPILTLACLDSYYMGLERAYRKKYERVAETGMVTFSLALDSGQTVMGHVKDGCRLPVLCFYGGLLAATLVAAATLYQWS